MVEVKVSGEQWYIQQKRGCCNPKVIFAHVSGGKLWRWRIQKMFALTVSINIGISVHQSGCAVNRDTSQGIQQGGQAVHFGNPPSRLFGKRKYLPFCYCGDYQIVIA